MRFLDEVGAPLTAGAEAVEGWRVVYPDADVPAAELARTALETNARAVALSSVYVAEEARLAGAGIRVLRGLGELREYLRA